MRIALTLTLMMVGCAHTEKPVESPPIHHEPALTLAPMPTPVIHEVPRLPVPCGQSTTVKVGKLNVNMPKGGKLEIEGIKTSTEAYSITLEGVEFINTHDCK